MTNTRVDDGQATRWAGAALAMLIPLAIGLSVSQARDAGPAFRIVPFLVIVPALRWGAAYAPSAIIDRESAIESAIVLTSRVLISSWELLNGAILVLCACTGPIGAIATTYLAIGAVVGLMAVPAIVVLIPMAAFCGALAWSLSLQVVVGRASRRVMARAA
jgi:hypothetical protein